MSDGLTYHSPTIFDVPSVPMTSQRTFRGQFVANSTQFKEDTPTRFSKKSARYLNVFCFCILCLQIDYEANFK